MKKVQKVFDEAHELCSILLNNLANDFPSVSLLRAAANEQQDSNIEFKVYPVAAEVVADSLKEQQEDQVLLTQHVDQSLLTLLVQSPPPSGAVLQLATDVDSRTAWLDAPARPDAVLINAGDLLARIAPPLRATVHRVQRVPCTPPQPRSSVAYFCMPQWHHTLDTHEQVGDLLPVF